MDISPTGFVDPDGRWDDEPDAYDKDTGTYASHPSYSVGNWGYFLELTHSGLWCTDIKFYCYYYQERITSIDLDAYYNDTWNHVYQGAFDADTWYTKNLGGTFYVSAMRIRMYCAIAGPFQRIKEVYFVETLPPAVTNALFFGSNF